jgi:hypothetical protein
MDTTSQYATGDRLTVQDWDGSTQEVTVVGWEQVLCPIVINDAWTDEERAHYARLRYSLLEPAPFTIHPDSIVGPAKKEEEGK